MSSYEALRHFADSYGLLFMALVYLVLCGWAFLPGGGDKSRDAANLIFEDRENG